MNQARYLINDSHPMLTGRPRGRRLLTLALLGVLCLQCSVWAQSALWLPEGTTGHIYYNNGWVGIGTTTPGNMLDVRGPVYLTAVVLIDQDGTPYQGPWIGSATNIDASGSKWLHIGGIIDSGVRRIAMVADKTVFSGKVGIATTNPQYTLSVNGNIGAQDVIVTNTGWSDYVFKPGYRVRPLSEVAQFIETNGHLPDIPTEAEVKEKGVSLGDMQAKLLAKVEELTLHMIQQDGENRDLRERLTQQDHENRELRARLARLETQAVGGSTRAVGK